MTQQLAFLLCLSMSLQQKVYFTVTIVISWSLDFFSKLWMFQNLKEYESISIINNFFNFTLVYNTGGVFGIAQGNPIFFQTLTGLAILFLLIFFIKTPNKNTLFIWAISFILGGAFGNFTDRFFRKGVIDFIDIIIPVINFRWFTFNVADSVITIGAVLLFIAFYQMEKQANSSKKEPHAKNEL